MMFKLTNFFMNFKKLCFYNFMGLRNEALMYNKIMCFDGLIITSRLVHHLALKKILMRALGTPMVAFAQSAFDRHSCWRCFGFIDLLVRVE